MTIGQLIESITGKACALYGGFGDCTAFNQKGVKIDEYGELLLNAGYHSKNNEIMYNGMTGEQIETEIFVGPTYYMRLKHRVKDKIIFRRQGPNEQLTRQCVGGCLRIGEIEKDSIVSYGATNFLTESMMERGDKYHFAVCNKSGMTAIYNPEKNLFLSPIMDGPVKFSGITEGNNIKIENVSQYGRDFSVISVPYSLKLLMQELGCINIQFRIVTEDNIEQLDNLASSFDSTDILKKIIIRESKIANIDNINEEREDDELKVIHDSILAIDDRIEPNIVPIVGEMIYGWKQLLSTKHEKNYWFNESTNKSSWCDPPEIVRRNELLNIVNENKNFVMGDSVYYLGGDMSDPSLNPSTVWKIDNISIENKIISLIEIENSSNYNFFSNFDIELLRHTPTTSVPTIPIPIPSPIPIITSIPNSTPIPIYLLFQFQMEKIMITW